MPRTVDGFVTENDKALMAKVAELLNDRDPSLQAFVQHTGGGIFCIELQMNGGARYMCWGTASETWGGDLNDADGNYLNESPITGVPSNSTDPDEVANAIYEVVQSYHHR